MSCIERPHTGMCALRMPLSRLSSFISSIHKGLLWQLSMCRYVPRSIWSSTGGVRHHDHHCTCHVGEPKAYIPTPTPRSAVHSLLHALQDPHVGVDNRRRLAMHEAAWRTDDVAAKGFTDALVSHAHAEQRNERPELPDCLERNPRLLRLACHGTSRDTPSALSYVTP